MTNCDDWNSRWTAVEKTIFGVGLAMAIAILGTLPMTGQAGECLAMYAIYAVTPFLIPGFVWVKLGRTQSYVAAGDMKTIIVAFAFFMPLVALILTALYIASFHLIHGNGLSWSRIAVVANHSFAICLMIASSSIRTQSARRIEAASGCVDGQG